MTDKSRERFTEMISDLPEERMPELKPCPFCGGEAKVRTWKDSCELFAVVKCTGCGAESNLADDGTKTKEENIADAIAAWNHRPDIRRETIDAVIDLLETRAEHLNRAAIECKRSPEQGYDPKSHIACSLALTGLIPQVRALAEEPR